MEALIDDGRMRDRRFPQPVSRSLLVSIHVIPQVEGLSVT